MLTALQEFNDIQERWVLASQKAGADFVTAAAEVGVPGLQAANDPAPLDDDEEDFFDNMPV